MLSVNNTLAAQNNGRSWRDCNYAGYSHQWVVSHVLADGVTYWRCKRESCAVDTRTTGGQPPSGDLRRR
jgi:hypothetical protein